MTQPLSPQDLDLSQLEGARVAGMAADLREVAYQLEQQIDDFKLVAMAAKVWPAVALFTRIASKGIDIPTLLAEVIRLRAEVERLARDAARYRALREEGFDVRCMFDRSGIVQASDVCTVGLEMMRVGVDLDTHIDAALAAALPSIAASEAAGAGE